MLKVTVQEAIVIGAPREKVWDYTQDWNRRAQWDDAVVEVISTRPLKARFKGGLAFNIDYKLQDRPRRTALAMTGAGSRWLLGGGGSWRYDDHQSGGTHWIQTNTLVLADRFFLRLLRPLFAASLRWSTRRSMRKAKLKLETLGSA